MERIEIAGWLAMVMMAVVDGRCLAIVGWLD